ncbi:hypothetical protein OROMI_017247 [Orobanche minor]
MEDDYSNGNTTLDTAKPTGPRHVSPPPPPSPARPPSPKLSSPSISFDLRIPPPSSKAGEEGRLPILLLKLKADGQRRSPAVVFLLNTNKCKEWLRPLLEAYASRDYTVAIDSRYHGERATNLTTYQDVLWCRHGKRRHNAFHI